MGDISCNLFLTVGSSLELLSLEAYVLLHYSVHSNADILSQKNNNSREQLKDEKMNIDIKL